jgi:eukaryotic-like serine/threonine-protein kinase
MAECPKCHAEARDDSKFCGNCATPLGKADATLTQTLETPLQVMRPGIVVAGKYKVVEELGHGGMGVVYKAEDLKLKRSVALKFLPPHLMDSPDLKERFLVEAQAAAALNHPNVCVIHEIGEDEGRPYIAMEFVDGQTLKDRLRQGSLKASDALAIAGQVAAGLGEAHHMGIIHRDVKSANIMVTAKGQTKVMDFGLAKFRGGSSLTKSQTTIGTVAYMSPEQARGQDLDPRTDIWSLAVVLYEMLAGKLPFRGDHDQAVIHQIVHAEPEPLKKARPDAPPGLEEIVGQALAKKPADRYQSMEEFREDLEAVAEGLKPLRARPRLAARRILGIKAAYLYAALPAVLALLIGLNVGGMRNRILGQAAAAPAAIRLAVLPFENLSGDPEQEYFSDGMTQEMIAQLGRLHPETLSVIARSSVMRYKKTNTPIDQIGRELDVGYVLEGSAQREGTRVRIQAELIRVKGQSQVWADSLEREMSGVLALQNEVSKRIASALALKLLPAEQASLAVAPTVNPEAHEAYLRGSYSFMKMTPGDMDTAEKYFDAAIAKDPTYAPAYAGRSLVWNARNQMGFASYQEAAPKARAAALKGVELDANSALAQMALASVRTFIDWDWEGARGSWRRALEINPNDAFAQVNYAHYLIIMGSGEEALVHSRRAATLDLFNPTVLGLHAAVLYFERLYDESIEVYREGLRLQKDNAILINGIWNAYYMKGMAKVAFEFARATAAFFPDPKFEAALAEGYARGGYAEAMRRGAEFLAAHFHDTPYLTSQIAILYAMAGENGKALDWLEKGLDRRDSYLPYVGDPVFDAIRSDPRFQELCRRVGIPADHVKRQGR